MSVPRLARRDLLRALGLGAASLPFVPLLEAQAATGPAPKRIVFLFSSNGTIHESWLPKTNGRQLVLSPILAPLEAFKSKLLVVDGLSHKVILEKSNRSGHTAGMNTALTGRTNKLVDLTQPLNSLATGISVDQHIAAHIGDKTKLRSLELGVQVETYTKSFAALSYSGPEAPMLPENSPYRAFDRLFRDFAVPGVSETPEAKETLADRQRVLEAVSVDLEAARGRLPQADRVKMEGHLESIRGIQHSLTTGVGAASGNTCAKPDLGKPLEIWKNDNIPALGRLQMDLLVMAMACDLTRVGTVQFGRSGAGHRFNWLGPEYAKDPLLGPVCKATGLHALAHHDKYPITRGKLVRIHTWYAEQMAYLLGRLAAVPERGGTMLDNTLVVWVNELGTGGDHGHERTPWVIGGNAGRFFKTGQLASFPGEPHNRLLVSLCQAMGVPTESFGDPDYCAKGGLTGVTA